MPITDFGHRKVIITCAVTGGSEFNPAHPAFPVTPKEIADSAIETAKAGAAVVHVRVRDPQTGEGLCEHALFKEASHRIRQAGTDVILNLTCGGLARLVPDAAHESKAGPGTTVAPAEVRYRHIEVCLPDMRSLDVRTSNQGDGGSEYLCLNTSRRLRAVARSVSCRANRTPRCRLRVPSSLNRFPYSVPALQA
ncbi:MAG: 3-keto-5-aminohexanoate cleavage protein [Alphaproteobacteria bacterium]|nr:3-keto-5-aminohexanoate cleavage protein [Alphaproteobacteria bacterium]